MSIHVSIPNALFFVTCCNMNKYKKEQQNDRMNKREKEKVFRLLY